jgi:hypothetical protein
MSLDTWDWKSISTSKTTDRASEEVFGYTGFASPRLTGELEQIHYDSMFELDPTVFTVQKFTLATMFSDELLADNQNLPNLMTEAGKAMGESHKYIRELLMAQHFVNAFTATSWDGVAMCATHTTKSGDSLDNALTGADASHTAAWLGYSHFKTALITQQGLPIRDEPAAVICHPSFEKAWRQILESDKETLAATNFSQDKNVLKNKMKIITCRYLADTDAWFIVGKRWKNDFLFIERQKPKTTTEADFDKEGLKIKNVQRFVTGFRDHTYVVGNPGA